MTSDDMRQAAERAQLALLLAKAYHDTSGISKVAGDAIRKELDLLYTTAARVPPTSRSLVCSS